MASIHRFLPTALPSNHGVIKQQVLWKATRARLLLGLHYQSPNGNIFLEGYFHFSIIDILGQIILLVGAALYAIRCLAVSLASTQ